MKKYVPLLVTAVAVLAAPAATAEGWYIDAGYSFINIDVDVDGYSADIDLGAIGGQFGYDITPYLGIEGEGLIGVQDEEASEGGITASLGLNYLVGAYGKLQAPLGDRLNVFARAGIVNALPRT